MLKTFYFVCLPVLLILTDYVRSDPDYVFNFEAGGWLKLYTPKSWVEAYVTCHRDGAVLASPLNKGLTDALQLQILQFDVSGNIFLGTHDLYSKGHYVSVEGVPLSDLDIKWGSHARAHRTTSGDCLTMSADGSVHFTACTEALPFICYKKPENETMNECGTYDNEYHLNAQTGSCYKIHLNKQTWTRAYSICASEGGHLVILNNEEEARIVKDLFPPPPPNNPSWEGIYIGLGAWGEERIWTTIHGDKFEDVYHKWDAGEPNNYKGIEDRGQLLFNGNLDDTPKDDPKSTRLFACEKPLRF
ncbi:hypothetical protein PYW08_016262 [Mythimna loreyi]|uniref:Uncharacterized protein n=1 Tax=Mythimna loreyi TaxID=667449 RepID=A0ACC2QYV4_9NEOP|nr:hypothetical protein PYW08_016262 [Mythimna loreyi]